jgi:hypothetical protein
MDPRSVDAPSTSMRRDPKPNALAVVVVAAVAAIAGIVVAAVAVVVAVAGAVATAGRRTFSRKLCEPCLRSTCYADASDRARSPVCFCLRLLRSGKLIRPRLKLFPSRVDCKHPCAPVAQLDRAVASGAYVECHTHGVVHISTVTSWSDLPAFIRPLRPKLGNVLQALGVCL